MNQCPLARAGLYCGSAGGGDMLLDLTMLGLLIGLYGGCLALVRFCERLIGPQP